MALTLVLINLPSGPVWLPWLVEPLSAGFRTLAPNLSVQIGSVAVGWDRVDGRPILEANRVSIARIGSDRPGMRFRRLAVSVSPRALLAGDLVPRDVVIEQLALQVERAVDGTVSVELINTPSPDAATDDEATDSDESIGGLESDTVAAPEVAAERSTDIGALFAIHQNLGLDALDVRRSAVVVHDLATGVRERLRIERFVAARQDGGWRMTLAARGGAALGWARFWAVAQVDETSREMTVDLNAVNFAPGPVLQQFASDLPLTVGAGRLSVSSTFKIGSDGLHGPLSLTLEATAPLQINSQDLPGPVVVDSLAVEAVVTDDFKTIDVPNWRLESGPVVLQGALRTARDEAGWRAAGNLSIPSVTMPEMLARWPKNAAVGARDWIEASVLAGRIEEFLVNFDLKPEDFEAEWLRADALSGTAQIADATIQYIAGMEPVVGASADVVLDARYMRFDVVGGAVDEARIDRGTVQIFDINTPYTNERLTLEVIATTPLSNLMRVLEPPPVSLVEKSGIAPEGLGGTLDFTLELAHPLLRDLLVEDVDLSVTGAARDVSISAEELAKSITEASFDVAVDIERVFLEGTGKVEGVPVDLIYERETSQGIDRIRAGGRMTVAQLEVLGAPPGLPMDGAPFVSAILPLDGAGATTLEVDLDGVEISVPAAGIWKPAELPGRMDASIVEGEGGASTVDVKVAWTGVDLQGRLVASEAQGIVSADLDRLIIAGTDVEATVERSGDGFVASLTGRRLDLSPYLNAASDASRNAGSEDRSAVAATLNIDVDEVMFTPESEGLTRVKGRVEVADNDLLASDLAGQLPGGGTFSASVEGRVPEQRLTIESDDAGALMKAVGLSDRVRGGTIDVKANIGRTRPDFQASGTVTVADITIHEAPAAIGLISRLPSEVAAGFQPGDFFLGRIVMDFGLDGSILQIQDVQASGSDIAIRANGAYNLATQVFDVRGNLAPLAGLNNFIGNIPLIGPLLRGSSGAGAFVVTFEIVGPREDPKVTVNPLTVVAPGALRDLFGGNFESSAKYGTRPELD